MGHPARVGKPQGGFGDTSGHCGWPEVGRTCGSWATQERELTWHRGRAATPAHHGLFAAQGGAEHPGSCQQRGGHLRGACGQHRGQPHRLLGSAGVHQCCLELVWGHGGHRGALFPGIPMVQAAKSCIPHLSPPLPTAETLVGCLAGAGRGCPSWGRSALTCSLLGCFSQVICSYVLMPVAFLMGADWADSPLVAELLGIKIFLNEFVAYEQLATYKRNRLSGLEEWDGSRKQWISVRDTGMEPVETGHGAWLVRWVVGVQRADGAGAGRALWPTRPGCLLTAGYRVIPKESVKPFLSDPAPWWGRSWCYRVPCSPAADCPPPPSSLPNIIEGERTGVGDLSPLSLAGLGAATWRSAPGSPGLLLG